MPRPHALCGRAGKLFQLQSQPVLPEPLFLLLSDFPEALLPS